MAAELVLGLVGPAIEVVKLVGRPILRQLNYLCCFTSNISGLEGEAKKLDDAIAGLEGEVEIARDRRQEKPVPQVETWLTESKKIQVEITGILNEATNVESGCSKLGARFSLSRRAKKTTERTEKLRGEKPKAEFLPPPTAARQGVQLGKTFECESRNKIEQDIMTTLRGGDVKMIGIHGMGGLGKTTMAKKLMNRALHESVFDEVVIATVSQNVDISKIQDEIGGQLGLEKLKEEKSESARVNILHSRLNDTKRTLLVLDDVWTKPALESIGIPRDSKGCTILFTSRNHDALQRLDVGKIFGMKVFSEEEAWSFFREIAGTCVDDRELNPTAKKVAKECGGLPINLAAVGAGLKDERDAGIWNATLGKLEQNVPDNVEYDKETYNPLKWSYDYLKSKEAQSIFLLCCLFPEDADIPLDYLTNFCMGLRLFEDDITSMEAARNNMRRLTKLLKDRSLLLESDEKDCVRMHDVVRDVCTVIAKEEGYIGKDGCTWISSSHLVGERNELLSGSRCPKLHLLFLDSRYGSSGFKFDDAFLEGMRELHVLCIRNYSLTTLPCPTQSLGKLNTLILVSCKELKSISVVGELVNLEILICRFCDSIEKLPLEIKRLNRLKLLELTWCIKLKSIDRGIISSLIGLEELKMLDSFNEWEAEGGEARENASIKELEALPNLACLEIDIHDSSLGAENMPLLSKKIVRFVIRIGTYSDLPSKFSKAMRLKLERESRLGDWIEMQLLRDTEYLILSGAGANNMDLAKGQNIRWLVMMDCKSMKNVVRTSGGSDDATVFFPSIEHLELYNLPELQEICDGPISSTSFQNLKKLKLQWLRALTQFWKSSSVPQSNNVPHFSNLSSIDIYDCNSLRNLGQLSMAGKDCLPHLQQLSIWKCEMMEKVFLWNEEEAGENKTSILITKVFPKLKEVNLYDLPNLTTFYQGIQGIQFPLLMEMNIRECPKMKSTIDGSNSADIVEDDSLLVLNKKVSFGSLEVLSINKYGGSMSLFTLSMSATLRELYISECDEMIKVIEDNKQQQQRNILVFPKLKILYLRDLPKLVSFYDWKSEVEFPVLEEVDIIRCPNMERFSLGLVATPKLEAFKTDLSTYVGVGVDQVAFNSLKRLTIRESEKPFDHHKIYVSLFNGLEKLVFYYFKGSVSLFPCSAVGSLVNLKVFHIEECDEMLVKVIEDEEEKMVSGKIRSVVFPKLEELYLKKLPNLVRFSEWKCDVELPSLTKVKIEECPNMESFSMRFVAAPNLKIVEVDEQEIDATEDVNGALHQHYLARQEEIFRSTMIEISYNPFYGREIPSSALELLTINKYEDSMTFFTLSVAANLVSLRELHITNCGEMIKVIENEEQQERILLFPNLKILYLTNLPKLVSFCDLKCEVELPLLREVVIYICPNMKNFSSGLVTTPNLEEFTTDLTTYAGVGVNVAFNSLKELTIRENHENPFDHQKISVSLFNGLKELQLYDFKGSVSLFPCSAIGSLFNLKVFFIGKCDEIVKVMEDDEEEKVVSGGEIRSIVVFPKLEELYLKNLPNLVRFSEWKCDVELPSLRQVVIWYCHNMENFSMGCVSAPNLKIVEIDWIEIDATKDLNGALHQHYLARQEKEEEEEEIK